MASHQLQGNSLGVGRDRTPPSTAPETVAFPWQQLSAGCAAPPTPDPDPATRWACGAPWPPREQVGPESLFSIL